MYVSRKRKSAYTAVPPNKSESDNTHTAVPPNNSEENAVTSLTPNNSDDNTQAPLAPNNSASDNTQTAISPNNSDADASPLPEASVELINGDDSDLGKAPSSAELTYAEFLAANPETGILRVQAFIGAQGLPVSNALVTVSAPFKDGERVLYAVRTDTDGIADNLILPAPDREASQIPGSQNPFAEYNVSVSHPDYRTALFTGVPVFAGVKSIQPVVFLPRGTEG
jgi:hypothetical protein